jgi:hypothetical protein
MRHAARYSKAMNAVALVIATRRSKEQLGQLIGATIPD